MKDDVLINWNGLRESGFLCLLIVYGGANITGLAIGVFASTRRVYFSLLFIGIRALCGSMLLSQSEPMTINLFSIQTFLLYPTVIVDGLKVSSVS